MSIDHADYIAPTRQREPDHTNQGSICPERSTAVDHQVGIDRQPEIVDIFPLTRSIV